MSDNENKFNIYMNKTKKSNGRNYAITTINSYTYYLKTVIPNKLHINSSLFEIEDINKLKEIKNRLEIGDLSLWNKTHGNKTASNAVARYIEYIMNISFYSKNIEKEKKQPIYTVRHNYLQSKNKIKNIILYGVAGVGKTHNTNKLISLIESGKDERDIFKIIKKNEKSDSVDISDIKNRVKFITFHQSFGYEDFIEGFRPNEDGNIELVDGILKSIALEAQRNLDKSKEENKFDIELFLNDFIESVEVENSYEIDRDIEIRVKRKNSGDFTSFVTKGRVRGQSLTKDIIKRDIENFLDGNIVNYKDIKPKFESQSPYHGNAPYYYKLYQKMKEFLNTKRYEYKTKKEDIKNYYLIIDEINRGNISKIFGELITLIEESKRDNLEVILPYSKEPFLIPSNLYIIGTMNSSDKSIALIDIALRRRFTFLKMIPNANLIEDSKARDIFIKLNDFISKTLGDDYLIGHSYFMSGSELDFVLEYKIIPLLEEYYYGDSKQLDEALAIVNKLNHLSI
jgi:5-methylcytosine-specific restriction protein B